MKIIAGSLKNRVLSVPKNDCRPTNSQVREAVFNILMHSLENATFLDICAGSGAIGLEALSRGASSAYFLESNPNCLKAIRENISKLNVESMAHIIPGDLFSSLNRLSKKNLSFTVCYVDPPYYKPGKPFLSAEILKTLDQNELLAPGALLVLEESPKAALAFPSLDKLKLIDTRFYGDSAIFIFSKK